TTALGVACVAAVFVPGGVPVTETLSSVVTVDAGTGTIDVSFPYPAGQHVGYAIDPTSLLSFDQFTLGGAGLGSLYIDRTIAPEVVGDGFTVRYHVLGALAASGAVNAVFTPGSWNVLPTDTSESSTTTGVATGTVTFVTPTTVDISFPFDPNQQVGYAIDPTSLSTTSLPFSISGAGFGNAVLDPASAKVVGNGFTVEYSIKSGALNPAGGAVTVTFTTVTGWKVKQGTNAAVASTATAGTVNETIPAATSVDVTFPDGGLDHGNYAIDPTSLTFNATTHSSNQFTLTGASGWSIDSNYAANVLNGFTVEYRIDITGALTAGTATFTGAQPWAVKANGGGVVSGWLATTSTLAANATTIDVTFPAGADQLAASGWALDATSISTTPLPFTISGDGYGTDWEINPAVAATVVSGYTVRFAISTIGDGTVGAGTVTVNFT